MLSFKDLKIDKVGESTNLIPGFTPKGIGTAFFKGEPKLNGKITLFNKPKVKIDKAATRLIEPGYKIPTGQFHNVSQWCDTCQEVQGHAHKPEKRRMICLICKTIKTY